MRTLLTSLLLIGSALPAFATELTVTDWKSGDPPLPRFPESEKGIRGRIAASLWTAQEQADFGAGKLAWTSPQAGWRPTPC